MKNHSTKLYSKVDVRHPLYATPKTLVRFRKLKKGKTSDCVLTELMDTYEEVKRRK